MSSDKIPKTVFSPFGNEFDMNTAEVIKNVGVNYTKEYLNQKGVNFNDYLTLKFLKPYFMIDNKYVAQKIKKVLFPFLHKEVDTTSLDENEDSPQGNICRSSIAYVDYYIPMMSFVTFILVNALIMGKLNKFHPDMLGFKFSVYLFFVFLHSVSLRIVFYVFYNSAVSIYDHFAYTSYKFVLLVLVKLIYFLTDLNAVYWVLFGYTCAASMSFINQVLSVRLPKNENNEIALSQKLLIRIVSLAEIFFITLLLFF